MSQRLPEVIDEFERSRLRSQGMAKNTVKNERKTLDNLVATIGPIQVRQVGEGHIDTFLSAMQARGHAAGTMNIHLQALRNFFRFCIRRGYVRNSPVEHRRPFRQMPRPRLRIPADQFGNLLEKAHHPRDRMLVALGLFLWLRESEAINLRVGDVDLSNGEISVRVYKTKELDVMPISFELDLELRRWFQYYSLDLGESLKPDMYLVPAKGRPRGRDPITGEFRVVPGDGHLRPYRRLVRSADMIKAVLERAGFDTRDESGKPTMEGMHTLRRSGARARFDYLVGQGYDGAIREVMAGLHHKSVQVTERYLGIDIDVQRRYRNIKGLKMYGDVLDPVILGGGIEQASGADGGVRRLRVVRQADHPLAPGQGNRSDQVGGPLRDVREAGVGDPGGRGADLDESPAGLP